MKYYIDQVLGKFYSDKRTLKLVCCKLMRCCILDQFFQCSPVPTDLLSILLYFCLLRLHQTQIFSFERKSSKQLSKIAAVKTANMESLVQPPNTWTIAAFEEDSKLFQHQSQFPTTIATHPNVDVALGFFLYL